MLTVVLAADPQLHPKHIGGTVIGHVLLLQGTQSYSK